MSEAIWIAIISSGILSTLLVQLLNWIKERRKKPTQIDNALQWLMRDRLEHLMTKALVAGETTMHDKQFIHRGYQFYHDLGGNGDMTELVKEYDELPIKFQGGK